jgi:hypothetical protein
MIHEGWALVCEIGLWGWVAATIGLIMHAFPGRDTFRKKPAALWAVCLLLCYALWCVGMLNA